MTVPALVFDPRPHRMVLPGLARAVSGAAVLRVGPPLRLERIEEPPLPGPRWLRLRPTHAGICGSDLTQVGLQAATDNPLSAVVSFPHVMGHEIVAEVAETGADADGLAPGDRVAVDPWLSCAVRGIDPACAMCAAGHPPLCAHAGDPGAVHGRGMHLGNVAGMPGGFGALMVAHRLQCHPLPAGLEPAAAVLADPLAVALHCVDRAAVEAGPVLVLGAGTIGLCVVAVLRARHPEVPVLATAAWPHLAAEVTALGAQALPVDVTTVVERVAAESQASLRHPWRGAPWLSGGGCPVVIDTVGAASTLETALRCLAPRGRIVSVGVSRPRRAETTLVYYKEAAILGSNGYGTTPRGAHALDEALQMLAAATVPQQRWRTHAFPLEHWRQAFLCAMRPSRSGAIKVTLLPNVSTP